MDDSGCFGPLFRRVMVGSDAPDLLSKHRESFWISLHQHPLDEDVQHLPLLRRQRLLRYVRDHI